MFKKHEIQITITLRLFQLKDSPRNQLHFDYRLKNHPIHIIIYPKYS